MALPSSGAISLNNVNVELTRTATALLSMNDADLRTLFGAGGSGTTISMSQGWGKSNITPKGYTAGGYRNTTGFLNSVSGFIFSTETASSVAMTVVTRTSLTGVNSPTRGYFAGGSTGHPNYTTEIDGIIFSTEAYNNPSATLAAARHNLAGVNSTTKGYFGGGWGGSESVEIDGIDFASENAINPSAGIHLGRTAPMGVNSSTSGYFCGGFNGSYSEVYIDRFEFATEIRTLIAAQLQPTSVGLGAAGACNSTTKGYFGGGYTYADDPFYDNNMNTIVTLTFATETTATLGAVLTSERWMVSGYNSTTHGYFIGGATTVSINNIEGVVFSNDTFHNPSAVLSFAVEAAASCQSGSL